MATRNTMRILALVAVLASLVSTPQATSSASLVEPAALQYHVQTDQGDERFFRFQTHSGQYRDEKRNPDGSVTGSYGWVDPNGILRLFDYVSDSAGYRIVKQQLIKVDPNAPDFQVFSLNDEPQQSFGSGPGLRALHVGEGDLGLTRAVQVNSLVSTFDDENPDTRQTGATFFSGVPVPAPVPLEVPRPRVVIGARDSGTPRPAARARVVIGASDSDRQPAPAPQRTGFVIGAASNDS